MPFDANGNYTLPTIYIAIPGEVIKSTQHNTPFEDVQAAFNNTLCRDGRTPWAGNQNANNNKITGLAAGVNAADAVRMDQVATLDGDNAFKGKTLVQNVADFTSQEAIPAAQADGRYIQRVSSANTNKDFSPNFAGINRSTGQIWLHYKDDNGVDQYAFAQPPGDYATNPALHTETTNRTNADTNLQNQINNRVLKTGDTSTGGQFVRNKYDNGNLHWAPGWTSVIDGMSGGSSNGDYSFTMWAQELDGSYTAGILSVNGFQGRKDFRFNEDGNIFTPLGTVALTSQLPFTDQNLRVQVFNATASNAGFVTLPQAFRTLVGVTAQQHSSGGGGIRPIRIETNVFHGNGFNVSIWAEGGGIQYTFVAYGYF